MRVASIVTSVVLAAVLGPVVFASARAAPHVSVTATTPLTVHGAGFRSGERVTVTAAVPGQLGRRLVTAVRGAFTVRFKNLSAARCTSYRVAATGSAGSYVAIRLVPECAPGPTP